MANLVRNFIKGRMNKSVDERLVPDGEYIHAENVRLGSTEDSEIGAVENTKGNEQLTTLVYPPTGTALSVNAACIGSYADGANETIYWFVHDPTFTEGATGKLDLIVSFNVRSEVLTYHVISIDDGGGTDTSLNFNAEYLITGVDFVDDLLFFTDDYNPPRRLNVKRSYREPVAFIDDYLLKESILVIKRPPEESPEVVAVSVVSRDDYMEERFLCFGYRWEYENNEYSATSQFSDPIFEAAPYDFSTEDFLNEGMVNVVQTCNVTVETGGPLVVGIDILFKEMDDSIIRVIQKIDKSEASVADDTTYTLQFNRQKIFTILPESEILRLYDNVPRLAKAQTLMGNRIVYGNYLEGYDLINRNGLGLKLGFSTTLIQTPLDEDDGREAPRYYSRKSLHSNRVYEVGIVYMDEYGRSSTALTAAYNKVEIDCGESIFQNQIRVTIPPLMLAPEWATRYKFVIKADADAYETVFTSQTFEHDEEVYLLLEGENSAKVEKGDNLIVKKDTSGAVTTCTTAKVLEKKAYAVDEIAPGTPQVPGTYMKMEPSFSYELPQGVSNMNPGRQTAGTNGGDDQRTESGAGQEGDYPYMVYQGFDDDDILAGTRIRLQMKFTRQGRGDASCETRILDFDETWVVETDYLSSGSNHPIIDWFYDTANNDVIDDIENATGISGAPNVAAPTNQVEPSNTSGATDFGVSGLNLVNRLFFNFHNQVISFVAIGTNKCSGLLGSGSSPNRRSRIEMQWTVIRSVPEVVFETQPAPTLPDLWYESSKSYRILPNGLHTGDPQNQTPTQPALIDTAFFNCITFGNGVESYKIRDSLTGKPMTLGNRVTTTSDERFSEVRRFADLTYSGVINDETNINKLNEFNLGLLNFKPLEDLYGPVEKLFGRRTDILTLQEDKISYVLAGKNLLTDATGKSVVTSVPEVLGTQVARVEEYGISNNPESFAQYGPHKFFTDAKRGAVIHLFGDAGQNEQLKVISEMGMRSWFRDMFIEDFNTQKLGGYDPYMDEYVLASNNFRLPGEEPCIDCDTVQTFVLTPTQQSFCVSLGFFIGPVTVSYNVLSGGAGDEATLTTTYNGNAVVTSGITTSSSPPIPTINKDSLTENILTIDLDYTPATEETFVIQVLAKCPQAQTVNIRLVTVSNRNNIGQSIHSEFQWVDGDFASSLSSTAVSFQDGTDPIVSDWQEYSVPEGANLGPVRGAELTMTYNRIKPDNYVIRPVDTFKYLRTNTDYKQVDIVALLAAIPPGQTLTPSGADPQYTADFVVPSGGDYLYLIWDYSTP